MTKARKKQQRKPAGEDVVKTFDNTPDDAFERDAAEIFARQVGNYTLAEKQIKEQETKAIKALEEYEKARQQRRNHDESVGEVIRAIESYEATRQQLGGIEKPSEDAIREALSLHLEPQVRTDTQKVEDFRREAHCALAGLLEIAKDGCAKPYALDTLITLLDHSCAELQDLAERPARGVSEVVKKVLASRVRLPLSIGTKPAEIERIKRLLKRYEVGLPHKLKEGRNFELQAFAGILFSKTKALRGQIELRGPSNDDKFEQQLARLPLMPDKRWIKLLRKAPKYFHGSKWLETEEHCARWAEPWIKSPRKKIKQHRAKKFRRKGSTLEVRMGDLKDDAMDILAECFSVFIVGDPA